MKEYHEFLESKKFVGLSDSFEAYYQAVHRCWRFGQKSPVDVYIVISDAEGCAKENIERKQRDAERMTSELVRFTKNILAADLHHTVRMSESYYALEREVPLEEAGLLGKMIAKRLNRCKTADPETGEIVEAVE